MLTGGPIVDAIWRRLLDRADPRHALPMIDDPDLHLMVDGQRVDAAIRHGTALIFPLFATTGSVRIVSRAAVPCEFGLARDPRCLGVALRQLVLRQGARFRRMLAADPRLVEGFHAYEADNRYRWTDGYAVVPPQLFVGFDGRSELLLDVGDTVRYLDDGRARQAA